MSNTNVELDFEVLDAMADEAERKRDEQIKRVTEIMQSEMLDEQISDTLRVVQLLAREGTIFGLKNALEELTQFCAIQSMDYDKAVANANKADRRTKVGKQVESEQSELAAALHVVLKHFGKR